MIPTPPNGSNGTGIDYPTIELDGKMYTVKFTRGALLYRLSKSGSSLADLRTNKNFATLIDILHAGLYGQYDGTSLELAELISSGDDFVAKYKQMDEVISEAIKKAFPPTASATVAGAEADKQNS
jgi:hypothetical protein